MFDEVRHQEDVFGTPMSAGASAGPDHMPSHATELSLPVQVLLRAVERVAAQAPAELPGPQALADASAVLGAIEQLHVAALARVADVDTRKLHTLAGSPSTSTWVAAQQTSLDRGEVALAKRLASLPRLQEAVQERRLCVAVAERVGKALAKLRPHLDRPDGLIDGQPADQVLLGVIGHGVRDAICEAMAGLDEEDPRLAALLQSLAEIVEAPVSQLARMEAAFVLLAEHLEPAQLPGALASLVDACLPNLLEKRAADAHANRGFGLRLNADGSGWHITDGDLDLETGELLHTALEAGLAVDPDNPTDTQAYAQLRERGWRSGDPLPESAADLGACPGPRSLRQRRHDALKNVLRTLLDSGALGLRDKVAPHIAVTVGVDALHQAPGAVPAVASSGARLPTSLVRTWMCDSALTRVVLGLGRRVLELSHTERTLKPHERRAKRIETGGQCQGAGCRCGPGRPGGGQLVPHHPDAYARSGTTSFFDTVMLCEQTHHDLHAGRTLRLKDGRWLNEHGWTDGPSG